MAQETWLLGEIEVSVSGFFTTHHYVQAADGNVGKLTFPAFGQHGVYYAPDGRELLMQKTSWWATSHELLEGDNVRGTADRRGTFRRDMLVHLDGRRYTLEPEGIFSRGWLLLDAEGRTLLEVQPRGVFKQGAIIATSGVVETDLLVFAYYLVWMRWQEDTAAAGAAAAS